MTFPEKIRALCDAAELSEVGLAEKAGLPFGTFHGYAIGRREPPASAIFAISNALRVSADVFAECWVEEPKKARGK